MDLAKPPRTFTLQQDGTDKGVFSIRFLRYFASHSSILHSLKVESSLIQVLGLAAISSLLFLFKLGQGSLLDWDEAIYAEISKETVHSHHWLTLYWQHAPFFEKPPLSLWITAALFHWFGVNEFWARFESAAAGVGIILLTYAIARRLSGATGGFFAAFVLLTTRHFDHVVREGTTDAPLCLCIYLAIYCYQRLRDGHAAWFYLMCASIGLGAMIKGPAILVVPLAISVDRLFKERSDGVLSWREYCLGFLLTLSIVAPWHIWMIFRYGRAFLDNYIGYQMIARATSVLEGHSGGPLFYARVIFHGAFPWSVVAVFAALRWVAHREWGKSLPWALLGVTLIMYSLVPTKLNWYIVPVYPAMAIGIGGFLAEESKNRPILKYASVAALALGTIVAFIEISMRQGDPFTNEVAQIAKIAGEGSGVSPLFIITRPNSEPELDTPTAAFYSDRRAKLLEMPADALVISDSLKSRTTVDAIIHKDAFAYLSQMYDVHPIAQNDSLSYSLISRKH
jgi:4-amino-4-deoxy-L-arabinose transferase-like glycosyltransferase